MASLEEKLEILRLNDESDQIYRLEINNIIIIARHEDIQIND